jgi:glutamate-1-semialdehyde 2,1-aminomutase
MRVVAIVQARMGSKRLPKKMLRQIKNQTLIEILLKRLSKSKKIDEIVLATSKNKNNDSLVNHVESLGYNCYRGSEDNVLKRYLKAGKAFKADVIIRITGDCPLTDHKIVDYCVDEYFKRKVDYLSNTNPPTFPDGLDVEVFSFKTLQKTYLETKDQNDLEHVTPYMHNSSLFKTYNIKNIEELSHIRLTVDEEEDFNVIEGIFKYFNYNTHVFWKDVIKLTKTKPYLFFENKNINRNEGSLMGKGQKLYKRAKRIIPGGNMLLSKRPEMFLPDIWPAYFNKALGCTVWDLDNIKYTDMSLMGVGTNILGYANKKVDDAVISNIKSGNMSTLNCPEEVYLAERLIEMHEWSDMVRFARSGGEANAIAIRIARAACGKNNVAVCGYHGWHDWYLAANIADKKNLSDLLLPGLDTIGVPSSLKNSVFPFKYNDFDGLKKLVDIQDIGVIKMEVYRNIEPQNNFLKKVRKLANDKNIVLIFDECTSGFRETFGGLHKKYGVNPDMAMFGKAMGNGYGITATIGRRNIMEAAQKSFISSTFWTERVGPTAALKTLELMEAIKSWEIITKQGNRVRKGWDKIAKENNIEISISGLPSLSTFTFNSKNHQIYKTFITQEMLKINYLASNSIYTCIDHSDEIIDKYLYELNKIFGVISKAEKNKDTTTLLDGPISHSGFSRLN